MAISKILNMKDCGGHFHGKHLKRALDYVMNPDKTQDGRLVGAINCQVDTAFEQMKETKRNFGKIDKRQGYHIILSFKENEVNPDTAFEITQKFVEEYLGKSYEAVFVVHDNTAHVHSHIVFNSVSFVDGKKYRYEKGDWAKYIQPITNRLCQEYGLSIIDVDDEKKERQHESYKEWSEYREGNFVWSDMIKRDLDACILQAKDYEEFLELLSEKGYQIKQGKHLAIKPQGMTRFRRCKSLGDMYCEEAIRDRIVKEDIAFYKSKQDIPKVSIVKCRVKRYRRAGLSGLQKKEYVDWAVKVLTVVRSVWSTFSGEGASEWRESVHKEFIKTGITPKDYLDFVCSILHISRKVKIILLDGTVQEAKILDFLDMSYDLTDGRIEESIE